MFLSSINSCRVILFYCFFFCINALIQNNEMYTIYFVLNLIFLLECINIFFDFINHRSKVITNSRLNFTDDINNCSCFRLL